MASLPALSQPSTSASPPPFDTNYILHLTLTSITTPSITRTLSVPSSCTFSNLHHIIQTAFSWSGFSSHCFQVFATQPVCPGSWRERHPFVLPHADTPRQRRVRKMAILKGGKSDEAMKKYGIPVDVFGPVEEGTGARDSGVTRLKEVFEDRTMGFEDGSTVLEYGYYTDQTVWTHDVDFMGRQWVPRGEKKARVLGGEGHPAAEDVKRLDDWFVLRNSYDNYDQERKRYLGEWYETVCVNGDPEGLKGEKLWKWDMEGVQKKLDEMRWDEEPELEMEGW